MENSYTTPQQLITAIAPVDARASDIETLGIMQTSGCGGMGLPETPRLVLCSELAQKDLIVVTNSATGQQTQGSRVNFIGGKVGASTAAPSTIANISIRPEATAPLNPKLIVTTESMPPYVTIPVGVIVNGAVGFTRTIVCPTLGGAGWYVISVESKGVESLTPTGAPPAADAGLILSGSIIIKHPDGTEVARQRVPQLCWAHDPSTALTSDSGAYTRIDPVQGVIRGIRPPVFLPDIGGGEWTLVIEIRVFSPTNRVYTPRTFADVVVYIEKLTPFLG
jgi:hypothetical protein